MCGIVGFLNHTRQTNSTRQLSKANEALNHRGPDQSGYWLNQEQSVGLAHRRLSILDLSETGSQPMHSHCCRYTIVFNGEIYNFREIRAEIDRLSSINWKGSSDTEVLINSISFFGLEETLKRCDGMFAFALWDKLERRLVLVRDRMGEKPLYYTKNNTGLYFASELKALLVFNSISREINCSAVDAFLRYSFIPEPLTIFKEISKLEPGTYLEFDFDSQNIKTVKYWNIQYGKDYSEYENSLDEHECLQHLELLLENSVERQMTSDVPIGAFLSGGVDSTLIATLMQEKSETPIDTFTISYDDKRYDESSQARMAASLIGSQHHELTLKPRDLIDIMPQLSKVYDEPFADSSQIPTYLISKFAKQKVTVCLTGDGGDELFGGYNRHRFVSSYWSKLSKIPRYMRNSLSNCILSVPPERLTAMYDSSPSCLKSKLGLRLAGEKMHKFAHSIRCESDIELYNSLLEKTDGVVASHLKRRFEFKPSNLSDHKTSIEKFLLWDQQFYLPSDILTKVDRASMSVSLETRAPFLSREIIEFSWLMSSKKQFFGGANKLALRRILQKKLNGNYTQSSKMGFGLPIESWFRDDLKNWAGDLLSPKKLEKHGFLNSDVVKKLWNEHLTGKKNWHHQLWNFIVLQQWLETYTEGN